MLAGGVTGLPPSSQTEGISDRSRKYALTGLTAIDSANETTSERNKKDWVKFCFSLDSFLLEMCFQMSLINLEKEIQFSKLQGVLCEMLSWKLPVYEGSDAF